MELSKHTCPSGPLPLPPSPPRARCTLQGQREKEVEREMMRGVGAPAGEEDEQARPEMVQ